jgi:hypothetical protein
LFFLDAHFCNVPEVAMDGDECPLLQEIDAIGHLNELSVLIVDDALLFMMPPPPPHDPAQWPTIDVVLESLRGITPRSRPSPWPCGCWQVIG